MFGLKVESRAASALFLALPQDQYLVSAGAHLGRWRHERGPAWFFQASGVDENDDHLRWLSSARPRLRSVLEVTVVDSEVATPPRRLPRQPIDWHVFFARQMREEQTRLLFLEDRLRRLLAGSQVLESPWVNKPAAVAVRVSLNKRVLGRIAVEQPGGLSATVYAKRRGRRTSAALSIHGGAQFGTRSWRWYDWSSLSQPLRLGDQVRLEFVEPRNLMSNIVQSTEHDASTRQAIAAEIADIQQRLRSDHYATEEALMRTCTQTRPRPHRYSRSE